MLDTRRAGEPGPDYALELMAAKQRSDTISSASALAHDTIPEQKQALSRVRILTGDALKMLRTLPIASVDVCVTSPPYFGSLRNYQCEGQIGNEPTIEAYVHRLVAVFQEVRRTLREQGSPVDQYRRPLRVSNNRLGLVRGYP